MCSREARLLRTDSAGYASAEASPVSASLVERINPARSSEATVLLARYALSNSHCQRRDIVGRFNLRRSNPSERSLAQTVVLSRAL